MRKLRLGPHTQQALTLLHVECRDPAPSKKPPRNPPCMPQEAARTTPQSPMELVMPTAHSLDLEVPGEVGQGDLLQLSLQSQHPLLGRCRQGKTGVSLVTLAPLLFSKFFSGSHLPWIERPVSLLTVITAQAAQPTRARQHGARTAPQHHQHHAVVRPVPILQKRMASLFFFFCQQHDQERSAARLGCGKHWQNSRATILAMMFF